MTRVKICGIRRVEDALVAVEEGADFLGFVFYEGSRRYVPPELARDIIAAARAIGDTQMVGVFVNAEPSTINGVARVAGLDYAQLSGDEPEDIVESLELPAIQVIHMRPELDEAVLAEQIDSSRADVVLLDTAAPGYGGTGRAFDWTRVPPIDRPFLLAGGLDDRNVAEAIHRVHPWGVDVSSGVETAGEKDPARIRQFLAAARQAASLHSQGETEE